MLRCHFNKLSRLLPLLMAATLPVGCATETTWPDSARVYAASVVAACPAMMATAPAMGSTVRIVARHPGGELRGTGFVVRQSAGPDGLQRILTAAHILGPPGRLQGINVATAEGMMLGEASVVAISDTQRDLAVLAFRPANEAAAQHWRRVPGLSLARVQRHDSVLIGMFARGGPDFGASGAPVMDSDGQVRAVLTGLAMMDERPPIPASAVSAAAPWRDPPTRVVAQTVSSGPVLAMLGRAGSGVSTTTETARGYLFPAQFVGFPRDECVQSAGQALEAINLPQGPGLDRLRAALR